MVISGPLSVTDIKDDLETKAKNFLKLNISNKKGFLHSHELNEEIRFLVNNGYVLKKEGAENPVYPIYEITSKGREYIEF